MEKHNAISFMDYEKISDDLCFLGRGIILRFNVQLAHKNKDKTRDYSIKEFRYSSSKYINKNNLITVRRSFDYYLSIDISNDFANSVIIKPKDMFNLQSKLNAVCNWFSTLFKIKDGKLIISGKFKNIKVSNLIDNKYIEFEPVVINYEDNTCTSGVRIYVNSSDIFADIDVDKFMGIVYTITKLDMYQCALSIIASIPFEPGQNVCQMESYYQNPNLVEDEEPDVKFKKKYQSPEDRKKGFFD